MKRLTLLGLVASLVLAASSTCATVHRWPIYIPSGTPALPTNQTFNLGAKTPAGYGGCDDSFSNIHYIGTHAASLVFQATGTVTSADSRLKIDSHHCVVPNGSYGGVPTVAAITTTYVITDQNGASGNLNVNVIANRWDVTNINAGTNVDTISSNQLLLVLQRDPTTNGPVMGDSIYLRPGMIYDPPQFDTFTTATATPCALCAVPGDIRIKPVAYTAQSNEFLTGNGGGPYTAFNLPDADWINITTDTAYAATIRHLQINGTNRPIMGFRFTNLNLQLDYDGTHGFTQGLAILTIGSGATTQSFVRIDHNTFQSNSPVVGQRGQQGIAATTAVGNGSSGCTTATMAYFDNAGNMVQHGSGAAATATIAGGVVTAWTQTAAGRDYDSNAIAAGGSHAGQGTYSVVTSDCAVPPTATPRMTGLDVLTGISAAGLGKNTELYIHDNAFVDMWVGMNLNGNQNVAYSVPTNFWIIGNSFDRQWDLSIQLTAAAPAYSRWNFVKDMKWASGFFHTDCEIRLYSTLISGSTYPFGDEIGNICVRATGQALWGDAQGWFMSNPVAGATMSGCLFEGNIYVGTFANVITLANCDSSALVAFNTIVQDPTANIANLNQLGTPGISSAGIINKYSGSSNFDGQSLYNAVAGNTSVWSGGSPTDLCNVKSLGLGTSGASANAYAAPPADFTTLTSIAAVQAAFQPKVGGTLLPASTGCMYKTGTGGYFDYVNRVSTAPF